MASLLRILFVVIPLLFATLTVHADQPIRVAKDIVDFGELPTGRPATLTLWFPEGQCETLQKQQHCLSQSAITDKTIVLSHGAMGAAENYSWIAESLAAAGFIVIGINHFGESWRYGQDTQDARAAAMLWQRPADISAIYDALSNRELFQKKINWSNVIAIGHSSGGQTVAMLAGVQYDLLKMINFCRTAVAVDDQSCNYGIRNGINPGNGFLQKMSESYRDTRIKKIIMLDPTIGYGATQESMAEVQIPTLIVGAQNNDFLPWNNHGSLYAKAIPKANVYLLTGHEGHFVFLDNCNNDIRVMGVSLCQDKPGVDRIATHATLSTQITNFVRENNMKIDAPKRFSEKEKSLFNHEKMLQILLYTPHWVFYLFASLFIFGLLQVRSRRVPIQAAFIMPVAMLIMSFVGTVMHLGFTGVTTSFWLFGAILTTYLSVKFSAKSTNSYDRITRKLIRQGSWVPLIIIMAIFCTRYALGVSIGMNLAIIQTYYFAPLTSFLLGSLSGYFIAQGISYLQLVKAPLIRTQNFC